MGTSGKVHGDDLSEIAEFPDEDHPKCGGSHLEEHTSTLALRFGRAGLLLFLFAHQEQIGRTSQEESGDDGFDSLMGEERHQAARHGGDPHVNDERQGGTGPDRQGRASAPHDDRGDHCLIG